MQSFYTVLQYKLPPKKKMQKEKARPYFTLRELSIWQETQLFNYPREGLLILVIVVRGWLVRILRGDDCKGRVTISGFLSYPLII